MATNTAALKVFAQQTRTKLISLITTKMQFVLNEDTAELRGYEREIGALRKQIREKTEKIVIEEVAYTWFNRVMALRFMDANGYNAPKIVTPATGQTRPEILQDAMGGSFDEELMLTAEEKILPETKLYRKLLVAVCNKKMSVPMPFLFEHISDYTELLLPDDLLSDQSFVNDIRNGMTDEDCQNVEIMGWLYQFYITDRKADAETKKSKKGGLKSDEQAAATQLFTPHWIVRYMVENSLGRIWMTLHPESSLIKKMPYYIATPEGQTDTIPEDIHSAKDIRFIDPCMGSGHILVYAFDLLTKMYEEEGEQTKDIPALILENNLYGIDIDRRCYQLASFALTMKARAYYRRYLRNTVKPHVIALEKIDRDVIESVGTWDKKSLMWQFENIDTIGSLLKVTPEECAAIKVDDGLFRERQKLLKTQAEYLSRKYHCVVTNPPYLGKGMSNVLKDYIQKNYPNTKKDTMATFMERCINMCSTKGKIAMINMQSWMFISSYEDFRINYLPTVHIDSMLHLGTHAFDEIGGEIVNSTTFVISNYEPYININGIIQERTGIYYRLESFISSELKEKHFLNPSLSNQKIVYSNIPQSKFAKIPGYRIGYWASDKIIDCLSQKTLADVGNSWQGLATGDNARFIRYWYEISLSKFGTRIPDTKTAHESVYKWFPLNKGGGFRRWYGSQESVIAYDTYNYEALLNMGNHLPSRYLYFQPTIAWNMITTGTPSFRYFPQGFISNNASNCYCGPDLMTALGFLNTKFMSLIATLYNPTTNLSNGVVGEFPYLTITENGIKNIILQCVNISQEDWDSHETSWDFKTNELLRLALGLSSDQVNESTMSDVCCNVSLESLVSQYKTYWSDQFMQLHSKEEELNRKFIDIYGLQDELTPDVPLDEVTILQKGEQSIEDNQIVWHEDVIIKQFISYLIGCFMGRYSVNKPGLIIASQGQKIEDLDLPVQTLEIDNDGIIPVVQEEDFFADDMTQRIEAAVKTLFGEEHFYGNMKFIKQSLGQELRDYMYKNYYADHQQLYSVKGAKRPIYWLFSSQMGDKKKKGYFKALVYMHRLEADTLSKLHADYVHPYIQKIEHQLIEAEDNATRDDLSQAQHNKALKLADELREKVREVKAFETTLVEIASARITIDLDDGVKANYPKFYPLVEPIKGLDSKEED